MPTMSKASDKYKDKQLICFHNMSLKLHKMFLLVLVIRETEKEQT